MNKTYRKNLVHKMLWFLVLRAVEITALSFLAMFLSRRFEGLALYLPMGAAVFVYLLFVVGCFLDDYAEKHRYDDVVL